MRAKPIRSLLALATGAVIALACAPADAAPHSELRGFVNNAVLASPDPAVRAEWLGKAVAVGAQIARIDLDWASVAPVAPSPTFNASDAAAPAYRWTNVDAAVRDATAHGLRVVLTIYDAPAWAEARGRPADAPAGSWRPDPTQLAAFAHAAATRYSGTFPDPAAPGATLPAVRYWQIWNEPNLSTYLTPQWAASSGGLTPTSPDVYRGMLNAAYNAIKAVDGADVVVEAGTAPYGDLSPSPDPGGGRLPPVTFLHLLLCLGATNDSATACPDPAHFDVLAHHPYAIAGPRQHAINSGDATIPDLGRLTDALAAAIRAHTVIPDAPKPLWVTEFSWDSNPPDPQGVPALQHAEWLEEALYLFWRQGVSAAFWLEVRDQPPIPDYASTYQSGVYLLNGQPKLAATAYSFPFIARQLRRRVVEAWGIAPASGTLTIQRRARGGRWVSVKRLRASSGQVFDIHLALAALPELRARIRPATSLPWIAHLG